MKDDLVAINEKIEEFKIKKEVVEQLNELITIVSNGTSCNDAGKKLLLDLINQFEVNEVIEAINISFQQYYNKDDKNSFTFTMNKVGGICYNRKNPQ